MENSTTANPIRYSVSLMLFLTLCLLLAEHQTVWLHGDIDADVLVSGQSGTLARQFAYVAMGILGLIGTYSAVIVRRVELRWNGRVTLFLSLLLGWCVLSLLWAATPAVTAKRLFVLGLMLFCAFGVSVSWSRFEILKFLTFSSATQVTVDLAAEVLTGRFTPWQSGYQFSGMLAANRQGYVCMVLALSALCIVRLTHLGRWISQILAAYGFVFLLLTRSRGGLFAFSCALLLYLLVTLKSWQIVLALTGVGALTLILLMSGIAPTLVSALNRGGEGSEDFNGRGPLWEELMTYVDRRPLTGYGYEDFWTVATIDDVSSDLGWAMTGAHSGYIESLLELGWPGATLHALALLLCMGTGISLFRQTGDYAFLLGAALCLVYLTGGLLEGILIVKASEISFDFALLLCVIAVQTEPHHPNGRVSRTGGWPHVERASQVA